MGRPTAIDERFMRAALRLARRARGRTRPNPIVGAVLVQGDRVVGQGYHRRAGTEHAEVAAISDAGDAARGATLYVNLEPCNHRGRTGPCAQAIVKAQIARVVVGMRDPNPLVNGKGLAALRRKGVQVCSGVLEQECCEANAAFSCYIVNRRPLVLFKSAITLDGHVAARNGDSRWVTGPAALKEGHRLRAQLDAIMVGVGTVLLDDPQLTCRLPRGGRDPVRVVVDSRLRTPPESKIVRAAGTSSAPTWIVAGERAPARREAALRAAGAEVLRLPLHGKRVDPSALMTALAQREITSVLLEGGPTLAGSLWDAGLVDRVVAFLAPKILGDPQGYPMMRGGPVQAMGRAVQLTRVSTRRVGDDVMISGVPLVGGGEDR